MLQAMVSQKKANSKAAFSCWVAVVEVKAEGHLADLQHAMEDANTKK